MKKFVGYFRVSTDKQGILGLGMQAQKEAVAKHIGTQGSLIAEFVEVESGKNNKRPQISAALDYCKKHKATLIIARLDRLSRNVHFISGLHESKVDFVCCDNPHATKTMVQMLAVFAEHEREIISQRTKDALQQVKRELELNGSRVSKAGRVFTSLGNPRAKEAIVYARAHRKIGSVPDTTLQLMREWRGDGQTLQAIAHRLNDMNIRTPQGSQWYASTVSNQIK